MVPPRSPTLQRGGQNPKWPGNGPGGYIAPAAWRVPNTSERKAKSEVAHKWAGSRHNPCHLGVPQCPTSGDKIKIGPQVGRAALGVPNPSERGTKSLMAQTPAAWGVPNASKRRGKITSGLERMARVAT